MAVANTLAYYYEAIITVVKGATTFSLMTLSIKGFFVTLTINDMQHE